MGMRITVWERLGTVGNSYEFLVSLIQVWCDGRDGMFGHGKPQNVQNHGTLPGMVLSEPGHQNGLVQRGTVGMVLWCPMCCISSKPWQQWAMNCTSLQLCEDCGIVPVNRIKQT